MFGKINITILSPDKSKEISVEVNTILTVSQIISELVQNKFIVANQNYALLTEKDGRILSSHSSIISVQDNAVVRVVVFSNGKKINVTILHPTNGQNMDVEINDELSVNKIIDELIACNFIDDSMDKSQYSLFIKNSQMEISGKQTLASGGTVDGSVLRVIV